MDDNSLFFCENGRNKTLEEMTTWMILFELGTQSKRDVIE